ncbi:MAG: alpha/beta hydrolase [Thermoproteota archaeon]|nr:alpha/beta hydrolase [Thermoproteota archaeon]
MTKDFLGVENETRVFLEKIQKNSDPPLYKMSPDQARSVLSSLQSGSTTMTVPAVDSHDYIISGRNSKNISIRIVRPVDSANKTLPIIIYFHGGGWVLGGIDTHDRLVRELSNSINAGIVFVNYSRSPEAKYPVALEEAYDSLKWISENANSLSLDPTRLAVAGDSVGGNMATAVTMLAKIRGGPRILYQVLFYPVTNANFDTQSYQDYQDGYFLTREAMKWFWDSYISNETDLKEPTVSPLLASTEQLSGLPSALVITGEFDVLRDEGEAYAHKLMDAGVRVTACRYHGTIHDFVMLNDITRTPAARGAIEQASHKLRRVLWKEEV